MTVAAAVNLGGAQQRLLPEAIPSRFFATAVFAHTLAWAGLAVVADDVPFYWGGPGPAAAAIHTLTLGVLLSTAVGASLQMLPVALGVAAPSARMCNVTYGLMLAGGVILIGGFAAHLIILPAAGAVLLLAAVGTFAATLFGIVGSASGNRMVRYPVWAAIASLTLAVTLAVLLASDTAFGVLPDHHLAAVAHMVLAAFGFMGMLALGFSQILIPMFAVAEPPRDRMATLAFGLALAALAVTLAALAAGTLIGVALGALTGLAAAGCHVLGMARTLAKRMRKRLGGEFLLIRFSWAMLLLGLILAASLALDLLPPTGPALFGFVVLFGWLLSLLTGVLQRVLPFLASMHVFRAGARPLTPSKLVDERALRVHRWCHFTALGAVAAGILFAEPLPIRLGALTGAAGAVAYGWFAASVFLRTRDHLKSSPLPRKG